jgi:hypothetical protein
MSFTLLIISTVVLADKHINLGFKCEPSSKVSLIFIYFQYLWIFYIDWFKWIIIFSKNADIFIYEKCFPMLLNVFDVILWDVSPPNFVETHAGLKESDFYNLILKK